MELSSTYRIRSVVPDEVFGDGASMKEECAATDKACAYGARAFTRR
jgi:hypothetical protein